MSSIAQLGDIKLAYRQSKLRLKALTHPTREQISRIYSTGQRPTIDQLATTLKKDRKVITFHLNILRRANIIEP
jgi:DNA-binding transcriptional ArsR family regulator